MFLHFLSKSCKRRSLSHLAPKLQKGGAQTICFISLLGQGAKWAPKCDFGCKRAILEAEMRFLAPKVQKSILDPKITFWGPFRALAQKAYETNVSGTFFCTCGAKMQKKLIFALLGPEMRK